MILEASFRYLTVAESSRLLCLSRLISEHAVSSLKKLVLLENTNLQKEVRLRIWKTLFLPSLKDLVCKDYTGKPLDEDDNIIVLDVRRTYSGNKAFDKEVVFPVIRN